MENKHKLSYYTIITEPLEDKQERLAYSTRSGKVMRISEICYDFLVNGLIEDIPLVLRERLLENQIIVPLQEQELEQVVLENQTYAKEGIDELFEVIQPSAMCQLGCYYCGQSHVKKNLSDDLVNKIVQRVVHKFEQGSYQRIHFGWFGAEPLMGLPQIRAIYQGVKTRLPEVPISGVMITNGLSLKEKLFLELVYELGINRFEITLDGISTYHDQHRYTKKGGSSFDLIYQNLLSIFEREDFEEIPAEILIRCNVDHKNFEGVEPLIRKIAADGIQKKIASFYCKAVYSWGGNEANKISLEPEEFAYHETRWKILMARLGYKLTIKPRQRKYNTCIVTGGESEVYDAYGNVFNCTEIPYAEDYPEGEVYKLGNLHKDPPLKNYGERPLADWFQQVERTDKYLCHSCKLFPVCGSACPKAWVEGNPPCPSVKYNVMKELQLTHVILTSDEKTIGERLDRFEETLQKSDFTMYHPDEAEQKAHGIYIEKTTV